MSADREWREPIACEGCGRPVIHDKNRQPPRHVICGEQCRRTVWATLARERQGYTVRATLARKRQGDSLERHCQTCGAPLASKRIDVRYCSLPCRRKAYRQRRHRAAA